MRALRPTLPLLAAVLLPAQAKAQAKSTYGSPTGDDCESAGKQDGQINTRWSAHFPRKGAATYRVTFAPANNPTLPSVTFALEA